MYAIPEFKKCRQSQRQPQLYGKFKASLDYVRSWSKRGEREKEREGGKKGERGESDRREVGKEGNK